MGNPQINDNEIGLVWEYFKVHAEQRLKTFHFYIIIITLLIGSAFTLLKDKEYIFFILIGFLTSFFSFIFWRLDIRNKELINNAENELIKLEENFSIELFKKDKKITESRKINLGFSFNFNLVFLLFGFIGISIFFLTCLYSPFGNNFSLSIKIIFILGYSYFILLFLFLLFRNKNPFLDSMVGFFVIWLILIVTNGIDIIPF